jgi:flap endonuclease GEN
LEGTAPVLKYKTIAKRNEIRYEGEERKKLKKSGRSRFNFVIKECQEMLEYMGIICIKGYGEAEAMCAYLNEDGVSHDILYFI